MRLCGTETKKAAPWLADSLLCLREERLLNGSVKARGKEDSLVASGAGVGAGDDGEDLGGGAAPAD